MNGSAIGLRHESRTRESKECCTATEAGPVHTSSRIRLFKRLVELARGKYRGFNDHHQRLVTVLCRSQCSRHDSFTVAIDHRERNAVVVDRIQVWTPPFDPSVVVAEASEIVNGYSVASVTGDNCAGEWPVESFRTCGIAYERSEKNKSELYLALIPAVNGKQIELLDHCRLIEELRRLERRRGELGKIASTIHRGSRMTWQTRRWCFLASPQRRGRIVHRI